MKKTKILLVRHGFSVSNERGTFTGQLDEKLSAVGESQAKLLSAFVLENYSVDAVYSSPLSRAYETVQGVANGIGQEIIFEPAFIEMSGGGWEGKTVEEIKVLFPETYSAWVHDIGTVSCNDGESGEDVMLRAYPKLLEIAKKHVGETVVVGTHAGVIRALQCKIRNWEAKKMNDVKWVTNASVTEVEFDGKEFKEAKISIDSFLAGLKTEITTF